MDLEPVISCLLFVALFSVFRKGYEFIIFIDNFRGNEIVWRPDTTRIAATYAVSKLNINGFQETVSDVIPNIIQCGTVSYLTITTKDWTLQ